MSRTLILVTQKSTFSSCVVIVVIVKRQFISLNAAASQDCPARRRPLVAVGVKKRHPQLHQTTNQSNMWNTLDVL